MKFIAAAALFSAAVAEETTTTTAAPAAGITISQSKVADMADDVDFVCKFAAGACEEGAAVNCWAGDVDATKVAFTADGTFDFSKVTCDDKLHITRVIIPDVATNSTAEETDDDKESGLKLEAGDEVFYFQAPAVEVAELEALTGCVQVGDNFHVNATTNAVYSHDAGVDAVQCHADNVITADPDGKFKIVVPEILSTETLAVAAPLPADCPVDSGTGDLNAESADNCVFEGAIITVDSGFTPGAAVGGDCFELGELEHPSETAQNQKVYVKAADSTMYFSDKCEGTAIVTTVPTPPAANAFNAAGKWVFQLGETTTYAAPAACPELKDIDAEVAQCTKENKLHKAIFSKTCADKGLLAAYEECTVSLVAAAEDKHEYYISLGEVNNAAAAGVLAAVAAVVAATRF